MIKCALCGFRYDEKKSSGGCKGCGLFGKCGLVKCPNCGYETVPAPEWFKKNKKQGEKKDEIE